MIDRYNIEPGRVFDLDLKAERPKVVDVSCRLMTDKGQTLVIENGIVVEVIEPVKKRR